MRRKIVRMMVVSIGVGLAAAAIRKLVGPAFETRYQILALWAVLVTIELLRAAGRRPDVARLAVNAAVVALGMVAMRVHLEGVPRRLQDVRLMLPVTVPGVERG